jgi:hypothetical protein
MLMPGHFWMVIDNIEKKAIELNASSAKEAPVFKQKTFDWNPLATFDDHA